MNTTIIRAARLCLLHYRPTRSGAWISRFFDYPGHTYANPLDPDGLYLAFNAAAEWNCFLSLGWDVPRNSVDFYIESANLVSGLQPPPEYSQRKDRAKWDRSLLGVVRWCGLPVRAIADKEAARKVILRGHPYSASERQMIMSYCADDVIDTAEVASLLLPRINVPQSIFRAHFMRAVARIQRCGIPIDAQLYAEFLFHRNDLKVHLVSQLAGSPLNVYEGTTFRYQKLEALVHAMGLEDCWPKPRRKRSTKSSHTRSTQSRKVFSCEAEAFEQMAVVRRELATLAGVVKRMHDLRMFDLVIGGDGRSRYPVFPFATATGRCAPPSKRFLFQQSSWTRGFIAPPPGWAIAYLDYSAAEILIAAVLSGDHDLLVDYLNGDPYANSAIRMGLAPEGATKQSIGQLREVMKKWFLSTLYGASPMSLYKDLPGSTLSQAEQFVEHNHRSYRQYWRWSDLRTDIFLYETASESTVFGWEHHLDPAERCDDYLFSLARNRSRNFPMQATCAEILRWACVLASDDGITIHATVHDALLIGAPDEEIENAVTRTREHMIAASRLVLGVEMKVPIPEIIRYPGRMRDPRGAKVWDEMVSRLASLDRNPGAKRGSGSSGSFPIASGSGGDAIGASGQK
jgi:DNA polymerase I